MYLPVGTAFVGDNTTQQYRTTPKQTCVIPLILRSIVVDFLKINSLNIELLHK